MAQNKQKGLAYVNDFQTPENVADYMVELIPEQCTTVLEPTPGNGSLVRALESIGFTVTSPDDWWTLDKSLRFDAVCANFPFSSKTFFNCPEEFEGKGMKVAYEQLKVVMNMTDNLIILMPWFTISDSDVRLRMIKQWGLISVTALPRKTFQYARIQTCVLQMEKGYTGPTEFKVFDLL
jgi:type I restriction-modification system DNA methylase subunit